MDLWINSKLEKVVETRLQLRDFTSGESYDCTPIIRITDYNIRLVELGLATCTFAVFIAFNTLESIQTIPRLLNSLTSVLRGGDSEHKAKVRDFKRPSLRNKARRHD